MPPKRIQPRSKTDRESRVSVGPREQSAECKWSSDGMRLKLRLETAGIDCDLHEALLTSHYYAVQLFSRPKSDAIVFSADRLN